MAVIFCLCLYTNVKALEIGNVETVIVFRSLSPFFVCVAEVFVMKRMVPSIWTWIALIGIAVGAYGYCASENEGASTHLPPYTRTLSSLTQILTFLVDLTDQNLWWAIAYLASIVTEMVRVLAFAFGGTSASAVGSVQISVYI